VHAGYDRCALWIFGGFIQIYIIIFYQNGMDFVLFFGVDWIGLDWIGLDVWVFRYCVN